MSKTKESKHTPGPWIHVSGPNPWARTIIAVGAGEPENHPAVARTLSEGFSGDANPSIDNAHLIAAAPDMLDALEEMNRFMETYVAEIKDHKGKSLFTDLPFNKMQKAIAKAKGEVE